MVVSGYILFGYSRQSNLPSNVRIIRNALFELFLKGFGVTKTISSGYPPLVNLLSAALTDRASLMEDRPVKT